MFEFKEVTLQARLFNKNIQVLSEEVKLLVKYVYLFPCILID